MSRAAKATLGASVVLSGLTVWGVHFMQVQERKVRGAVGDARGGAAMLRR
jgi:hypothetical protein